jgi:hypothetical protein
MIMVLTVLRKRDRDLTRAEKSFAKPFPVEYPEEFSVFFGMRGGYRWRFQVLRPASG